MTVSAVTASEVWGQLGPETCHIIFTKRSFCIVSYFDKIGAKEVGQIASNQTGCVSVP